MKENRGILFILFSLGNGGSEKMLLNVLNGTKLPNLKKSLYLYNHSSYNSYEDAINVPVTKYKVTANNRSKFYIIFSRISTLLKIVKTEDVKVIFAFSTQSVFLGVIAKLVFPFKKIKVVVRLGSIFSKMFYAPNENRLNRKLWEFITLKISYKFSDKIVCLTNYMKQDLLSVSKQLYPKIHIIKNYIDEESVIRRSLEKSNIKYNYLICVGRLEREKNYPGIINAFSKIQILPETKLVILGDGSMKSELKQLILSKGLNDKVFLLGFMENPYKYIAKAQGLILFSSFEGLPNVVIEALICRTPVIVSDFPGVEDVITNDINGLIVKTGDVDELASAMKRLTKNHHLQKRLTKAGYISASEYTKSIKEYEQLIDEVLIL